jgi:hypothetical protein
VTKPLIAAIMKLLPSVNAVVAAHADGRCWRCPPAGRRECPSLGLAADALDLVIRCWGFTKSERDGCPDPEAAMARDLRAAVQSKRLWDREAEKLTEILDVLDLAVTQAEDAGICLPMLAGIGIAVVDSYRAVIAVAEQSRPLGVAPDRTGRMRRGQRTSHGRGDGRDGEPG